MSTSNPADQPPTPGAQAPAPQQPTTSVTMEQVIEGLAACLEVIEGKCDEKRERQLRPQIMVGGTVIKQIVERKLLLVAPNQVRQPIVNRKQRRAAAAAKKKT